MGIFRSMRIGVVGSYPIPQQVEPNQRVEWFLERAKQLGLGTAQLPSVPPAPLTPAQIKRIREIAEEADIEIEGRASGTFQLVGPNAQDGRARLLKEIEEAHALGCRIIRTGYGRLNVATSRFNRDWPLAEHLGHLVANLKEADRIISDNGLLLAIENHCDFTGRQWAKILDEVGSPNVGCALDTANGFTVFCDPSDDVQVLAPYAITTHIKDMRIVDYGGTPRVPMIAVGAALGDGNVDIAEAVKTLGEKSPRARGLHLIIETGRIAYRPEDDRLRVQTDMIHRSIEYLRRLLLSLDHGQ